MTATFCVLVAREEPGALHNRTRLFHAIVERIVHNWRKLRTPSEALYRRWDEIVPMLGRLALERLREHSSGLTLELMRTRLREEVLDGVDDLLEDLTKRYGVLILTSHGCDFALRWFAEYLAGRALRDEAADLNAAADRPWAFEPVRHAIVDAPAERLAALMSSLLADEDADPLLDRPMHLRRVQLAAVVAADLRDDIPPIAVHLLVPAIWRRLTDERSAWITAEMARATQTLARVGGPVWSQLERRILAALLDSRVSMAGWYAQQANTQLAYWIGLLRHREPKVGVVAVERLRLAVDNAEVRAALWTVLFDERAFDSPALAAGKALRGASRDESFAAMLPGLQRLLVDGSQIQLGAAALALRPDEADVDQLALGLLGAHNAGCNVRFEVDELASAPGGSAALDRSIWSAWRTAKHAATPAMPEREGDEPPVTGYVRWDLLRAIAPALHRLPPTTLYELVHAHDYSHALSHALEQMDASILPVVIDMMCERFICHEKVESVVRLARQHPAIGRALISRWRRIVGSGKDESACARFPGQALAALVEQACDEAVDALVEWLPLSRLGRRQWANEGAPLAASVFTNERVLAAGRQCLRRDDPTSLRRLAPAWRDLPEVWDWLVAILHNERITAEQAWHIVAQACTHATLPEPFAAAAARLVEMFITRHGTFNNGRDEWHPAAPVVLQFIEAHGLAPRLRPGLEWLAGLEGEPPCSFIQPMAAALVIQTAESGKQDRLAGMIAQRAMDDPALELLSAASLAALLRPASQLWRDRLLDLAHIFSVETLVLGERGKRYLRFLNALPARERGEVVMHLLDRYATLGLPWFRPLDNPSRRSYRPSDLLWQIAFEAGSPDAFSSGERRTHLR